MAVQQVPARGVPALLNELGEQALLLDVREPWEVQHAQLDLSGVRTLCIPMNEVPQRLNELPRDAAVLTLCHHGMRSHHVASYLAQQGYERLFNIAGGIDAWSHDVDSAVPTY